jgi:DNA-binding transcriptional LysR family regulator
VPPTFATQWFSPRLGALAVELPDVEPSIRTEPIDECHCSIRFARHALPDAHSELLMIERHVLVGAPHLLARPLDTLLNNMASLPAFWALPPRLLTGAGVAGGIALINTLGQLGGIVSPIMVGRVKDLTGSTTPALYVIGAMSVVCAVIVLFGMPESLRRREGE